MFYLKAALSTLQPPGGSQLKNSQTNTNAAEASQLIKHMQFIIGTKVTS